MNKKNKGFTLIELLAVIVILGIIMTIATTSVIKNIKDSKEKAKYIAAKEIVEIAETYFAANSSDTEVTIGELENYLEEDATNPATGENDLLTNSGEQKVCKGSYSAQSDYSKKTDNGKEYYDFAGYRYLIKGDCN